MLTLPPSLHHSELFITRLYLPFHFTSLVFHWNSCWKAPNANKLPQVRSEHWQTLNSRGTEVLSASKELIRLLLKVIIASEYLACYQRLSAIWLRSHEWFFNSATPVSEKLAAVPLYMGYPRQVLPLPLHKDFISLGVQPRLGRTTDKLWLGSLCPGDIPGIRAVHSSWSVLHTTIARLMIPRQPLLVPTRTHSASRHGGIQTNFRYVAVVTPRERTLPQGTGFPQIFLNMFWTYGSCLTHALSLELLKHSTSRNLVSSALWGGISVWKGKRTKGRFSQMDTWQKEL